MVRLYHHPVPLYILWWLSNREQGFWGSLVNPCLFGRGIACKGFSLRSEGWEVCGEVFDSYLWTSCFIWVPFYFIYPAWLFVQYFFFGAVPVFMFLYCQIGTVFGRMLWIGWSHWNVVDCLFEQLQQQLNARVFFVSVLFCYWCCKMALVFVGCRMVFSIWYNSKYSGFTWCCFWTCHMSALKFEDVLSIVIRIVQWLKYLQQIKFQICSCIQVW